MKVIGIKSGSEVITQAFNFIALIEAILDVGVIPIICNFDDNLHLDIEDLCEAIGGKYYKEEKWMNTNF